MSSARRQNKEPNEGSFSFRTATCFWRLLRPSTDLLEAVTQSCTVWPVSNTIQIRSPVMASYCLGSYTHLKDEALLSRHGRIGVWFTTGFPHTYLERCSWYYPHFPCHVKQSEQAGFVHFHQESIYEISASCLHFCSILEAVVPRWTWSNKQSLASQLWIETSCHPVCLDVLGHAMWHFLLIRKPKTILKELSWCLCYLEGIRGMWITRYQLSAKPLSVLLPKLLSHLSLY